MAAITNTDLRPARYVLESGETVTGIIDRNGGLIVGSTDEDEVWTEVVYAPGTFVHLNPQQPAPVRRWPAFPYRVGTGKGY